MNAEAGLSDRERTHRPPRYEAILSGEVDIGNRSIAVRVVREVGGDFHVFPRSPRHPATCESVSEAEAQLQARFRDAPVRWRPLPTANDGERGCFVCGNWMRSAPAQKERYPVRLCRPCVEEAVDEEHH